tara:strand:+ start:20976 stop:21392 length:417 start_codon:yes stop_codon:yes gene_type:complete
MLHSLEEYITDWHWTNVFQVFLPEGRTSRFNYGFGMILGITCLTASILAVQYLFNFSMCADDTFTFTILVLLSLLATMKILLSVIFMLMLNVKRLHDINESGLWTCLLLMPVLGAILVVFLLFVPGYTFRNQFGVPPA